MINFVTSLPPSGDPHNFFILQGGSGNAEIYVTNSEGTPIPASTEQLVQAYMASLKGAANGYAALDGGSRLPVANLPSGSKPAEISSAISSAQTTLQSNINQKADSGSVYSKSEVNSIESGLQSQVNGKQATLSNATAVQKLGNGSYDNKPLVLLTATEW